MVKKIHEIGPESTPNDTAQADFQPISGVVNDTASVPVNPSTVQATAETVQAASGIIENSAGDASAASATNADTTKSAIPDLDAFLATLTADQIAKIRKKVERDSSIVSKQTQSRSVMNGDGSMDVVVHLNPQLTEQLQMWSDGDNMSLEDEARLRVEEALVSYLFGDWSAMQAKPVEANKT